MLMEKIVEHFNGVSGLAALVPGGLVLDYNQEPDVATPYAVVEDQGGTRAQDSTGDGPVDQNVTCWVFGTSDRETLKAARVWAEALEDAVLTLEDGTKALALVNGVPRVVTDQQLVKDVQVAYQVSFDVTFQS